jgi:hypothetical protein
MKILRPLFIALSVGVSIAAAASGARAGSIIDFAALTGGSITYDGGTNPLVATDIGVGIVIGLPSGTSAGCVGCLLSFETANLVSYDAASGHWIFGGGPGTSITITGSVPGASASGTLLTGSFKTVEVLGFGSMFKMTAEGVADVSDPNLQSFFGLPPGNSYLGSFSIGFQGVAQSGGAFASTVITGGDNVLTTHAPEPGTLLLLGSGLGVGYLARRRQRLRG